MASIILPVHRATLVLAQSHFKRSWFILAEFECNKAEKLCLSCSSGGISQSACRFDRSDIHSSGWLPLLLPEVYLDYFCFVNPQTESYSALILNTTVICLKVLESLKYCKKYCKFLSKNACSNLVSRYNSSPTGFQFQQVAASSETVEQCWRSKAESRGFLKISL